MKREIIERDISEINAERIEIRHTGRDRLFELSRELRDIIASNGGYANSMYEFNDAMFNDQRSAEEAIQLIDEQSQRFKLHYNNIIAVYDNFIPKKTPSMFAKLGVSPESAITKPTPLRYQIDKERNVGRLVLITTKTIEFNGVNERRTIPKITDKEQSNVTLSVFSLGELDYNLDIRDYSANIALGWPEIYRKYQFGYFDNQDSAFLEQLKTAKELFASPQ